jgi:hypothetical protein
LGDIISRWKNGLAEDADNKSVTGDGKIIIQCDDVLPYNNRLLLVCYIQHENSVEISTV